MDADVIVIGAGIVGAAMAYGLLKKGCRVTVLDGSDRDLRAARANFGLVWVQGKGADTPAYTVLTQQSSDLWADFQQELGDLANERLDYARTGGLTFCLSQTEYNNRAALVARTHNQLVAAHTEMIGRDDLECLMPAVTFGPDVIGASYCRMDGVTNPLKLLAALHRAIFTLGGRIVYRNPVRKITPRSSGFEVEAAQGRLKADQVIVAAGLNTPALTDQLGLTIPLRSERGQLLVTERLEPLLPLPASGLRQTAEGTVMIGVTHEKVADTNVTVEAAAKLASRATRIVPALASVRLVRQWGGLRVIPPDRAPIYAESADYPGLFAAACHSGVTLAAAHAAIVAPAMIEGRLTQELSPFSNGRFDVQKCA
ncbi:FAD-dependent oxidoreductase [Mesorhizobium sp. YR577]|uniref:NAD(P)/FAD-dependent oxidoreductase n=1 Tax=Mesorhizobium sp. YR577 TaxID=1884373 RepID=UPI0008EB68E3|nr:FAD-dependent oxidoreductase [Mesorhizobium sp. YR577]SFU23217.1 Glycine/D-amino acid oxidase [Mesorhizobium sp. YR577]